MTLNENYNTAVQRYGKILVQQILNLHFPSSDKYIDYICYYVYIEKRNVYEVCRMFRAYDILHSRNELTIDFRNKSFVDVQNMIQQETLSMNPLPNQLFLSKDKMVEIGLLKTFQDAQSLNGLVNNIWCICNKEDTWNQFVHERYTFYVIRNFNYSKSSKLRYVIAQVYPNERISLFDSTNNEMNNNEEYMSTLEGGERYLVSNMPNKNFENKQYKYNTNMNKQRIKLTESSLHRIIKESVKRVLREMEGDGNGFEEGMRVKVHITDDFQPLGTIVKKLGENCSYCFVKIDNSSNKYNICGFRELTPIE